MSREIGSEYHRIPFGSGSGIVLPIPGSLVFSGRAAIETVLKEIPNAKKACFPSYCCDSIIEPFRNAGIETEYYPVFYQDGLKIETEIPEDVDIFLWCNYFGFRTEFPDMTDFINRGGVIIEDITHSFLSDHAYHTQSRYLIASLRKWEPVNCAGYCASTAGALSYEPTESPPEAFLEQKAAAMQLKTEYLNDLDEAKKPIYLQMFGESNHWLRTNYSGLTIDQWSRNYLAHVNVEEEKKIRIRNAKILYEGLKEKVTFLFPEEEMDCPLFVPILLENRDKIRSYLIENSIYCPVHWEKPAGSDSNIYRHELSLICDQRYGIADMERIVSALSDIL